MRFPNICDSCVHLYKGDFVGSAQDDGIWLEDAPGWCLAFPSGIPKEIWLGGFDHRKQFGNERVTHALPLGDPAEIEEAKQMLDIYIRVAKPTT